MNGNTLFQNVVKTRLFKIFGIKVVEWFDGLSRFLWSSVFECFSTESIGLFVCWAHLKRFPGRNIRI